MRTLRRAALVAAVGVAGLLTPSGVASAVTLTDGTGTPVPAGTTGTASSGSVVDHTPPWVLSTTGAPDPFVPGQLAGRVNGVDLILSGFCRFTGNLVDGGTSHVAWDDNGAGAARIDLNDALSLSGSCGSGSVTGLWTLQGAAAAWTIT